MKTGGFLNQVKPQPQAKKAFFAHCSSSLGVLSLYSGKSELMVLVCSIHLQIKSSACGHGRFLFSIRYFTVLWPPALSNPPSSRDQRPWRSIVEEAQALTCSADNSRMRAYRFFKKGETHISQSCSLSPSIRANSRVLCVTTVSLCVSPIAAISISLAPIAAPLAASTARNCP
jgi:hypothetical protein